MSETIVNYPCQNCGHSDRMHRKLDGCMALISPPTAHRRRVFCGCPYKPDAIRTATLAVIEANQP